MNNAKFERKSDRPSQTLQNQQMYWKPHIAAEKGYYIIVIEVIWNQVGKTNEKRRNSLENKRMFLYLHSL